MFVEVFAVAIHGSREEIATQLLRIDTFSLKNSYWYPNDICKIILKNDERLIEDFANAFGGSEKLFGMKWRTTDIRYYTGLVLGDVDHWKLEVRIGEPVVDLSGISYSTSVGWESLPPFNIPKANKVAKVKNVETSDDEVYFKAKFLVPKPMLIKPGERIPIIQNFNGIEAHCESVDLYESDRPYGLSVISDKKTRVDDFIFTGRGGKIMNVVSVDTPLVLNVIEHNTPPKKEGRPHKRVVEVIFADGTFEKAVCSDNDSYSLEIGVSICLTKRLMGGTKAYNNAIDRAMKAKKQQEKHKKMLEDAIAEDKRRWEADKARTERRRQRRMERQAKVTANAIVQALDKHNND